MDNKKVFMYLLSTYERGPDTVFDSMEDLYQELASMEGCTVEDIQEDEYNWLQEYEYVIDAVERHVSRSAKIDAVLK